MQFLVTLGQMDDILAVESIFSDGRDWSCSACIRDRFLRPQAILIVLEIDFNRILTPTHMNKLPTMTPLISPSAIFSDVANIISINGHAIITGQLVFPGAVSIGVEDPLQIRTRQGTSRIRIALPVQNISPEVIFERPGRTITAAPVIIWIIYTNQLANRIIHITDRLCPVTYAGNVSIVIVGIGQRDAILRDRLDQASRAIRLAAGNIGVGGL